MEKINYAKMKAIKMSNMHVFNQVNVDKKLKFTLECPEIFWNHMFSGFNLSIGGEM